MRSERRIPGAVLLAAAAASATLALPVAAAAQSPAAAHGTPHVLVTAGLESRAVLEPHIAAHPTDAQHLAIAAMVAVPDADWQLMRAQLTCAVFVTRDGGGSWTRRDLPLTTCYDPWITFTADGVLVLSVLADHATQPLQREPLLVFRSLDGGSTWSETPVTLGTGHDRPMLVADRSRADRRGWFYLVSSRSIRGEGGAPREAVFVVRSRNGGQTFDEPRALTPNNLVLRAEPPVVARDGTLVIHYVEAGQHVDGSRPQRELLRRRAFVLHSHDGAATFSAPRFVTEACGPPGFATAALVLHRGAGPVSGAERLTHICNAAGGSGVLATTSRDGSAELWSDVVPVHPPLADGVSGRVRAAAARDDGHLGIVYTTRERRGDARCYDVYFVLSTDGGVTFHAPLRLSLDTYCPTRADNGATVDSWPDGGDYYGIAVDARGRFRLVWSDARSGRFQLYATTIEPPVARP